jgi:hypothetical protein
VGQSQAKHQKHDNIPAENFNATEEKREKYPHVKNLKMRENLQRFLGRCAVDS